MTFAMQPNIVGLAQHYNGRNFAQFQKTIMTIIKVTTLLGVAIVGMTYALGVPILNLIFAIDFSLYRVELIVIIIAGVINAFVAIMINTLTIMRKFREQVLLLLLGDGLLLLIARFAVKDNGMGAAIFLYTGISLLQAVLLYVVYRRTLKEKLNE
jgi:O-antigen/teichoic acid export membrane protein